MEGLKRNGEKCALTTSDRPQASERRRNRCHGGLRTCGFLPPRLSRPDVEKTKDTASGGGREWKRRGCDDSPRTERKEGGQGNKEERGSNKNALSQSRLFRSGMDLAGTGSRAGAGAVATISTMKWELLFRGRGSPSPLPQGPKLRVTSRSPLPIFEGSYGTPSLFLLPPRPPACARAGGRPSEM